SNGIRPVAWFDSDQPLRSGWAWGQSYLKDSVAVLEASIGKGRIVLYGPEILFRAQPHGTFKLLFNGIYLSRAEQTPSPGDASRADLSRRERDAGEGVSATTPTYLRGP